GDEPEALHKQRVAVRRLRALLRSAEPMLDPVWANQLREELGWLGRSLGKVRDLDVLLVHLREEVRALEGEDRSAGLRLIAALAETVVGKPATRFVLRARELQDVIGEHQDAVVAEERLRPAATKAHTPQAAISVGRLVERERVRRRRSRARVPKAWRKLERAGRQAWH